MDKELKPQLIKRTKWIDMGDFQSCPCCNVTYKKEFYDYYGNKAIRWLETPYCPFCGSDLRINVNP